MNSDNYRKAIRQLIAQAQDLNGLLSLADVTATMSTIFPELTIDRKALQDTIISEAVGAGIGIVYDLEKRQAAVG